MATVLVLVGHSGAGKTSVGQRLARQLNCRFVDSDALLCQDHHVPHVSRLLSRMGAAAFIDLEANLYSNLLEKESLLCMEGKGASSPWQWQSVVSTGGSFVHCLPHLTGAGRQMLSSRCLVVHLNITEATQRRRMKQTSESAADRGIACPPHVDPTNLFDVRTCLYNDCCDLAMDNNEDGERLEERATALRQNFLTHKVFHVK